MNSCEVRQSNYKDMLVFFKAQLEGHEIFKKDTIIKLAQQLKEEGLVPIEKISKKLSQDLKGYCTPRYIQESLLAEYKQKNKARKRNQQLEKKAEFWRTRSPKPEEENRVISIYNNGKEYAEKNSSIDTNQDKPNESFLALADQELQGTVVARRSEKGFQIFRLKKRIFELEKELSTPITTETEVKFLTEIIPATCTCNQLQREITVNLSETHIKEILNKLGAYSS